jgi:hypothetical protein
MVGEEVWMVGEHRSLGKYRYSPSDLRFDTSLKQLALLIKVRWVREHAHKEPKDEIGSIALGAACRAVCIGMR